MALHPSATARSLLFLIPATLTAPTSPYDCQAGLSNWKNGWSEEKKQHCCKHEKLGCPKVVDLVRSEGTTLPYSCHYEVEHWEKTWSYAKVIWCCQHQNLGCPQTTVTRSSKLHDCNAGFNDWKKKWSYAKAAWCCEHERRGCLGKEKTTQTTATTKLYDCRSGIENWRDGWTLGKKAWCCLYEKRGCRDDAKAKLTTTSPRPYDCQAGLESWKTAWSPGKTAWCCLYQNLGCDNMDNDVTTTTTAREITASTTRTSSKPYDCQDGRQNWETEWSPGKTAWCCLYEQKGCSTAPGGEGEFSTQERTMAAAVGTTQTAAAAPPGTTTSLPYDCDAGHSNWLAGWSGEKKTWCCEHKSRGCTPDAADPYDCHEGFAVWRATWSIEKQEWCCLRKRRGCLGPDVIHMERKFERHKQWPAIYGHARDLVLGPWIVGCVAAVLGIALLGVCSRRTSGERWTYSSLDRDCASTMLQ